MPNQNHPFNLQQVEKPADVFDEGGGLVTRLRLIGLAVPAAGQAEHAKAVGEVRGEVVKDVRTVAHPRQKKQRVAPSAQIQIVQLDAIDRGQPALMRRAVSPQTGGGRNWGRAKYGPKPAALRSS